MTEPNASGSDLKRQLLRRAVQDNLVQRSVTTPLAAHPTVVTAKRQRRSAWWTGLGLAALAVTVAAVPLIRSDVLGPREPSLAEIGVVLPEPVDSRRAEASVPSRFEAPAAPLDLDAIPLEVRRIVVDPGHGGEDTGTTGFGLEEKAMTLDIAMRVRDRLVEDGFEVYLTREEDRQLSLRERADLANQLRADLFLSIHINWIAERSVRGLETYFLGTTDDPFLNELVRRENRHSGYSVADYKALIESIYTGVRRGESRQFAERVQRSLYRSLLRQNPGLRDRGVKTAPFVVLVATEMPAILAEVSCLSNEQEAELLARPLYRDHIAEALARGLRRYADDVNQSEAKGS
ncbi:MAG: N-acetylmuramoyl-L-alanine amidase [Acidobacteriota bacterium]